MIVVPNPTQTQWDSVVFDTATPRDHVLIALPSMLASMDASRVQAFRALRSSQGADRD